MLSSGLVDIQSHTKSHRNLTDRMPGETDERYRSNLELELAAPKELLRRRLTGTDVKHLAYPFGDANATVIAAAQREGYELGLTVVPGANPFYAQPMLLRRTMIFGDLEIEGFKAKVQTSRGFHSP
jgi:peptidoglycan/xylan/chitin deacetylase (PgdA/CDA1 family)